MFIFCGCSKQPAAIKDYYLLNAQRQSANAISNPPIDAVVIVDKFAVAEGFSSPSFVYRNAKGLYETDYYRRFLTDKGIMLSAVTTQWLFDGQAFKLIADSRSGINGNYRLKGIINEMYADMQNPQQAFAVLKLRVFIVDKAGQVVFTNNYSTTSPIAAQTAEAVAKGWNGCLSQYLLALENDIAKQFLPKD